MSAENATFRQQGIFSTFSEILRNNCHSCWNQVCNILSGYSMYIWQHIFSKGLRNRYTHPNCQWNCFELSLPVLPVSISPALRVSNLCTNPKKTPNQTKKPDLPLLPPSSPAMSSPPSQKKLSKIFGQNSAKKKNQCLQCKGKKEPKKS